MERGPPLWQHSCDEQCLFFEQACRTTPGSNKPNTLPTNSSLIYNSGRAINQWCEIHANYRTESNKTSVIISHLNNHSFNSNSPTDTTARCRLGFGHAVGKQHMRGRAGRTLRWACWPACMPIPSCWPLLLKCSISDVLIGLQNILYFFF